MSEDVTRLRWLCENCDTVNETTLEFYVERSEAVGDEGVWDVREQPKPSDEPSVEAGAEVGGGEHRDLLLDD
jgi:hypothetical protein